MTSIQTHTEHVLANSLKELGESKALDRFLTKYGNRRTRSAYAYQLLEYVRWLRSQDVRLSLDDLVRDNLESIFKSDPTDVSTKRKHTDWLNSYVNDSLVKKGAKEATRRLAAATIRAFYVRNDGKLYGDFQVSSVNYDVPDKGLKAGDIRVVLKSLPINIRTPLLMEWQSSIEINRVLGLKWADIGWNKEGIASPHRIELHGRKSHRQAYSTFIGRNTIEHLKMLRRSEGDYLFNGKRGETSNFAWLNFRLKKAAEAAMREGIIDQYPLSSWRSHMLRHSFETEAAHAGVRKEIRGFFEGHLSDVVWVYNHGDELHPEDLTAEYLKIEPHVSLDYTESTLRSEYDQTEKKLLSKVLELERRLDALLGAREAPGLPRGASEARSD